MTPSSTIGKKSYVLTLIADQKPWTSSYLQSLTAAAGLLASRATTTDLVSSFITSTFIWMHVKPFVCWSVRLTSAFAGTGLFGSWSLVTLCLARSL